LFLGCELRLVFALAAVPAALSVLVLVLGVREAGRQAGPPRPPGPGASPWTPQFRRYLATIALFTLGNSSDAFLLLRAQEAGVALAAIPLLWTFHHAVKALASTHGGGLSDRLGRKALIVAGWVVYAAAYAGLALAREAWQVWVLFGVYGLFHALTEGAERALVADLAPPEARGRAFGAFHAVTGVLLLPASLLAGALWQEWGAPAALLTGAGLALAAATALAAGVPAGAD
jgi:MFS family permease